MFPKVFRGVFSKFFAEGDVSKYPTNSLLALLAYINNVLIKVPPRLNLQLNIDNKGVNNMTILTLITK